MLPLDESNAISSSHTGEGELGKIPISQDIIATILDITIVAWSSILALNKITSQMLETMLAGYLRQQMIYEKNSRLGVKNQIRIESEVGTLSSQESIEPEGRIDIKVIYSFVEDEYFSMECKRVSSSTRGKDKDLARKYIDEGILRFVEGVYSPNHDFGSMIGFVIDGNVQGCIDRVCKRLEARKNETYLEEDWVEETNFVQHPNLYRTRHRQYNHNSSINVLHLFLEVK
ncbi:MAG: hypothetical protein ACOC1Z_03055 [Cyanobacteriota bacterium]